MLDVTIQSVENVLVSIIHEDKLPIFTTLPSLSCVGLSTNVGQHAGNLTNPFVHQ